jgi:hypothetical protein
VAAIGNGDGFKQGRDFGAWLGLAPKQESTGDRTILGKISKRGNKYLRTLFVQAAHVILARRPSTAMQGLWPWIAQASKRLHRNMLAIALANKLARVVWAVLARRPLSAEDHDQCRVIKARSGSPKDARHPLRHRRSPHRASERRWLRGDGAKLGVSCNQVFSASSKPGLLNCAGPATLKRWLGDRDVL